MEYGITTWNDEYTAGIDIGRRFYIVFPKGLKGQGMRFGVELHFDPISIHFRFGIGYIGLSGRWKR